MINRPKIKIVQEGEKDLIMNIPPRIKVFTHGSFFELEKKVNEWIEVSVETFGWKEFVIIDFKHTLSSHGIHFLIVVYTTHREEEDGELLF